jgi:CSLREA domain-containing protein
VVTKTADTNDALCTGDDCSLREAVVTANNCPGHQTIRVPGGTYLFSRAGADENAADTGDLDITETVTIEGDLGASVIVDGADLDRIFHILPGAGEVVISGLEIRNGYLELPTGWARGGGILNEAELSLRDSSLQENHISAGAGSTFIASGGGLFNADTATLVNVTVTDNEAFSPSGGYGGGVHNIGTLTLSEVRLEANQVDNQGGGFFNDELATAQVGNSNFVDNQADKGGGLGNDGELTLENVTVSGNTAATLGGGIWNQFGQLEGSQVVINDNHANGGGGGFYNWEPASASLRQSSFSNNSSDDFAGGLYNEGQVNLERVSLVGNSSASGAGALYQSNAPTSMTLVNVTVSDNVSAAGSAAVFSGPASLHINSSTIANNNSFGLSGGASTTLVSTIISGHPAGDCNPGASPTSGGYNLIGDGSCGLAGTGDAAGDPLLQPLASTGFIGQVHPLSPSSPAIDAGVGAPDCPATDQRGVARPQGSACDIGAYEIEEGDLSGADDLTEPGEPTPVPSVTPVPSGPISINFNADSYTVAPGECTTVRWEVKNADTVIYEGVTMPALEAEQVCPQATTTYQLVAQNEAESQEAFVTIEVVLPPPAAPGGLYVSDYMCSQNGYNVELSWDDKAEGEEGYRVYRDGSLVATLGPNATSYSESPPFGGPYQYGVEAFNEGGASNRTTVDVKSCQ